MWKKAQDIKIESEAQADTLEETLAFIDDPEVAKPIKEEIARKRKASSDYRLAAFSKPETKTMIVYLVEALLQRDFNRIWPQYNVINLFYDLLKNQALLEQLANTIFSKEDIRVLYNLRFDERLVETEDVAAILYLYQLINGRDDAKYDHIVIDETQDFSPLQLELILERSTNNSMTLVGDIAQSIYAYRGITSWDEFIKILPANKISFENITQSYRSTLELVNFSNEILEQLKIDHPLLAEPFNRQGKSPFIIHVSSPDKLQGELLSQIQNFQQRGFNNIAVIVKTSDQATSLLNYFETTEITPAITLRQLETDFKYIGGLVVLPVTLTKGMEFEAVILYNANEIEYSSYKTYDGRLLYVGVTRALHELKIIYTGELSGFLKKAKEKAVFEPVN